MPIEIRLLQPSEASMLNQVIDLADRNRNTLGFMPEQAFGPFAKSGHIIVAIEEGLLLGYILFRRVSTKYTVSITHLCVDATARGKEIPEMLFAFLRQQVRDASAISLKCRRDYSYANIMWKRLGFAPRDETRGRSTEGKLLTRWYYLFDNQLELFSNLTDGEKLNVVIDANVFYDLNSVDASDSVAKKESHSLSADWLLDDINICITDEIFSEINRNENVEVRASNRRAARKYHELKYSKLYRDEVLSEIRTIISRSSTPRNNSDLTHIANAVAAKARYFITQDVAILDEAEVVFEKYGLMVRRPVDLIVDIDELKNNNKYIESRFIEHKVLYSSMKAGDIINLANDFVYNKGHEKINDLRSKLRLFVSSPEQYKSEVWKGSGRGNIPHAAIIWRNLQSSAEVVLLRCKDGFDRLAERKVKELILNSAAIGLKYVKVSDQYISDAVKRALLEYNFFRDSGDNCWYRYFFKGIKSLKEVDDFFRDSLVDIGNAITPLKTVFIDGDTSVLALYNAEKHLWPGKIKEAKVPCYIIPIRPEWARSLFDEKMSREDIFGFDSSLLFSRRNVYYRSSRPRLPTEGRILWYVSKGGSSGKYGQIRAASYVETVTVSGAKTLFRKYESLGVYKWSDIYALAKEDAQTHIMGFEFADTELLNNPLSFTNAQKMLVEAGRSSNQFVAPVEISHELFMAIYAATC
jgi:ribosomal protein S18 acetylase RimI-like enzyme/predicted nucleic acid-binding protein